MCSIVNSNKGFTLAEVLITLTVIGVVAALTIPAVMKNVQEAQYKAAFKSNYSSLVQSSKLLIADYDGDLRYDPPLYPDNIISSWGPYFKTVKTCQYQTGCWHAANEWKELDGDLINSTYSVGMILSNGCLLAFGMSSSNCDDMGCGTIKGKGICGSIRMDINGFKGPI